MTTTGSGSVSNSAVCFLQMLREQKDGSLQILLHGHPSLAVPAAGTHRTSHRHPLRLAAASVGRTEATSKLHVQSVSHDMHQANTWEEDCLEVH